MVDLQNRLPAQVVIRLTAGAATLALLLLATVPALAQAEGELPVTSGCLISGDRKLAVELEVATLPEQRRKGLMGRTELAPDNGMLFLYNTPREPGHGFWMYRTQIPLDIAYLDDSGVIRAIRQMPPCPSSRSSECPSYPAGVAFSAALEMNQGFFEREGVQVGDRLETDAEHCHAEN